MGLLSKIYDPTPQAVANRDPLNPIYYSDAPVRTDAGIIVTPDNSLKYSVVWGCVRLISQQVAGLPLMVYERTDDGKKPATGHPLYDVLHDTPNSWQTSFQFREMMMIHVLLRGNAFAAKIRGRRGDTDELIPLDPDRMRIERLRNGSLRYTYNPEMSDPMVFLQDEMFHLCGPSLDGIQGVSVIKLAARGIGLAMAMEAYGSLFFEQNATPRVVLETPHEISSADVEKAIAKSWQESQGGLSNAHKVAVLKKGMTVKTIGISNEDSQFLESRQNQAGDVALWFLVKPHKVNELSRSTFNNIEHQSIEHLTDTIDPWLIRFERTIGRDLIIRPKKYFAEFKREGLLQADIESKNKSYAMGIQNAWLTPNQVRQKNNDNPGPPELDEYFINSTMVPVKTLIRKIEAEVKNALRPAQPPDETPEPPAENGRAKALARAAAERVVAKEVASLEKWFARLNGEQWEFWVDSFYEKHLIYACDSLFLPPAKLKPFYDSRSMIAKDCIDDLLDAPRCVEHLVEIALKG